MNKEIMFQVPLYFTKCINWENKKKELYSLCGDLTYNQEQHSDYHLQNENTSYSEKLNKIFTEEIEQFKSKNGFKGHKIGRSWFEKSLLNNHHSLHNHGPTGYSAVCYIEFDKNKHQPIQFVSPFHNFLTGFVLSYVPKFIEEGVIIFFPSVINHFVLPSTSNEERLVVSFNISLNVN